MYSKRNGEHKVFVPKPRFDKQENKNGINLDPKENDNYKIDNKKPQKLEKFFESNKEKNPSNNEAEHSNSLMIGLKENNNNYYRISDSYSQKFENFFESNKEKNPSNNEAEHSNPLMNYSTLKSSSSPVEERPPHNFKKNRNHKIEATHKEENGIVPELIGKLKSQFQLNRENQDLKTENERLSQDKKSLFQEITHLKQELEDNKKEKGNLFQKIKDLSQKNSQLELSLKNATAKNDKLTTEANESSAQIKNLAAKNSKLEIDLQEVQIKNGELATKTNDFEQKVASLNKKNGTLEDQIKKLNETLKEHKDKSKKDRDQLLVQLNQQKDTIKKKNLQIADLENRIADLKKDKKDSTENQKTLLGFLAKNHAHMKEILKTVDEDELIKQNETLVEKCRALVIECSRLEKERDYLKIENDLYKKEYGGEEIESNFHLTSIIENLAKILARVKEELPKSNSPLSPQLTATMEYVIQQLKDASFI